METASATQLIEARILFLQKRIKNVLSNVDMENTMDILAKVEYIFELQFEYQQINTLNLALNYLRIGKTVEMVQSIICKQIMEEGINNSSSNVANASKNLEYNAKREVFRFLSSIKQ